MNYIPSRTPRILFAIPPERLNLYRDLGNEPTMHMGLAYVATYVAVKLGAEVKVIDAPVEGIKERGFDRILRDYRPDILAMTAYTFQIKDAARTAAISKERFPDLKVIVGGYHANAIPDRTLMEFPAFDFTVFGEGEETAVELIQAIGHGSSAVGIAGVAYRENGKAVLNPSRDYIEDLTRIPYPDFSLFAINKYANTIDPPAMFWLRCIPLLVNRGCPYRCKFCLRSFKDTVRYRPQEHVMGEIERDIKQYRADRLILLDETFTINRESTVRFLDEMIRKGYNRQVKWMCQTRVDNMDINLLQAIKRAGCHFICFGIESGNPQCLQAVDKRYNLDRAHELVREGVRLGLRVQCTFILGLPGETEKTAGETIEISISLDPTLATFSILTPFPGTEIYDMAVKGEGGLRLMSEDWSRYGKQVADGVLELEGLPFRRLLALQNLAYRKFFLRPKKFFNLFLYVTSFKVLRYLLGYILRMLSWHNRDRSTRPR